MRIVTILLPGFLAFFAESASAQVDLQNPKTARDFYERGLVREAAEQFQGALADYKKAASLDPGWFDAHFTLSSLQSEMKDYPAAIKALAASLRARPKDCSALFNSGLCYESLRDYDNAIAYYTQALAEDADFSHYGGSKYEVRALAYHYRGRVYQWHKKDNVKAVADYTEALRLDHDIRMVLYRRARAYHDLGKYAKAHADFAAAYEREPDYPNLLNAWAWQLATCPENQLRDGKRALEFAQKTKDMNVLAAAYAETGAFDDAIRTQEAAINQLDRLPRPGSEKAAERRRERRRQMRAQLEGYKVSRPYRTK